MVCLRVQYMCLQLRFSEEDVQVWMCAHPPARGITCLGTRPKVHTGFFKAWTAGGLHTEVMGYLQV